MMELNINPDSILEHIGDLSANGSDIIHNSENTAIEDVLKKALVDPNEELKENPLVASIDSTPFATLGNFSCLIGKAKSKKTFLITIIIAAFLKGAIDIIQAYKLNGKTRIVWFDTEMSRNHVLRAYRRALKLSCDIFFHEIQVYDLRPHSPQERLELITHVLYDQNPDNDIAFVVIDGIRDLVTDINDQVQATDMVTWLMKVTELKDLHVCNILHMNKTDNKARGAIGTEIINKAETVLSVTKQSDSVSIVKAEFCRDKEISPFAFSVDVISSLPQILQGYVIEGSAKETAGPSGSKKISPQLIAEDKHREVMRKVFQSQKEYSHTELRTQAKLMYEEAGISFGNNKVLEFIRHCDNLGIINKNGKQGTKGKYLLGLV